MTDSMKFGPEWLRNLSGDNCNTGAGGGGATTLGTLRYQLAEHRYGREEMLALFDRVYKPPESLITFPALYVEKAQPPLALIQMTEDETGGIHSRDLRRVWNGGITIIGGRGRGSSVDRGGRGRTGRASSYSHYSRGIGFDDSGDGIRIEGQSYQGRNRPFDRSQSERNWSERNGASDTGDWNGSASPRKELSRGVSGGSLMETNWRRHRGNGEDDDGWRKWGRSSWRESANLDRDRLDRNEGDGEDGRTGSGRWEHRGSHRSSHDSSHHPPPRTARTWESNHHDNHDNLPEWATENPSESGGSFDASGAFHGGVYSDEDDDGIATASQEGRTRRVSEGSASNVIKSSNKSLFGTNSVQSLNRHTNNTVNTLNKEQSKPLKPLENKTDPLVKERRNTSPTKPVILHTTENISTKILPASSNLSQKKIAGSIDVDKIKDEKFQSDDTEINKSPNKTHNKEVVQPIEIKTDQVTTTTNRPVPLHTEVSKTVHNPAPVNITQGIEEIDLDRMKEEANAFITKLTEDEENLKERTANVPPPIGNQPSAVSSTNNQEKWFYCDPQGIVQGPFSPSEMSEWCKAGYFTANLMIRRACDERYTTLGELTKLCGRVPFTSGLQIPPLKLPEQVIPPVPGNIQTGMSSTLPKTGIEDPLLLLQYQQMQCLRNQLLIRQMRTSAISKLSQSEHWATLSPVEQNQLILQYVMQDSEIPEVPLTTNPFVPHLPSQTTNPVMQLFTQMQQTKTQPESHLPGNSHTSTPPHPASADPIQQLIQQIGGIQNLSAIQQSNIAATPASTQEEDPIKSLLRQLNVNTNNHPQASHIDTVWPQPPPQMTPPHFNAQNWLAQVGPIPAMPPGQLPSSLWDLHAKEMKTEQQILEEQNLKLQEDRKKEELRKQEELQRKMEEENAKRKQKEEQARHAEEAKRKDEERKRKEEEKKQKEEEMKRRQEEEQKKKEEKKRKEEERKREEKRKQEEENLKKKQEEERKKREELKRQEEKQKREEEKRRKLEEEQKRQGEEKLRKEAELRRQAEAEEQARRAEQRRREAEALRKLQERSKAPWAQAPRTPAPAAHASLAEIQRLEKEKKVEEQRFQQLMQQQLAQQKAVEAAQEASTAESSKRLPFKWAEKASFSNKPLQVKSLAQIQQEEQVIVKQQERERQEKAGQKESANVLQNAGIWSTASQSLNWANSSTSTSQAWSNNSGTGFWDDPTPIKPAIAAKQLPKQNTATKSILNQQQQQQQNNKASKNKSKREEEFVKKLFEQNTAKTDDFTQWCIKALAPIQSTIDIPTFVGFLRDIESAYDVKEYVREYLGDTKQSTEFAKQFLEKRSKWRSAQRPQAQIDDLCKPAPAINPNAPAEFQETKGKSKKPKKGKMCKVDNRILGFSVTAAPDRINVGDRDYGEGV